MHQFIKSVLVKNNLVTFSGVLISDNFILITSHLIKSISDNNDKKSNNNETNSINNNRIWVIEKCNDNIKYDLFKTREAFIIGNLRNDHIKHIVRHCFNDIYDYGEHISDIENLFTIHVLSFDASDNVEDLRQLWWNNMSRMNLKRDLTIADELFIRAAPFGSRQLINSYSQGIVSNCVGGILLTDCPTVYGCEGGAVIAKDQNVPVGVVVSSMAGWHGECTSLTLAVTFNAIFCNCSQKIKCDNSNFSSSSLSNHSKSSTLVVVYIKCGGSWGTGICIDKRERLIITNAHVITSTSIRVLSGNAQTEARVVFKSPAGQPFDLALLRCDDLTAFYGLQDVTFSKRLLQVGDVVFTLGYPLFSHSKQMQATRTQGHVAFVKDEVIMTTCAVLPGASGGALCDQEGDLVGVVTCNILNSEEGRSYPRVNMSIPTRRIEDILRRFVKQCDVTILNELTLNEERKADWAISKL